MNESNARLRWQYKVVNLGSYFTASRLAEALAHLGEDGWEVIGVYDKASNWLRDMEKGFLFCKRPVLPGEAPEGPWAATVSSAGTNNLTPVYSAGHAATRTTIDLGPGVRVRNTSTDVTGTVEAVDADDPTFFFVRTDDSGELKRWWSIVLQPIAASVESP